MTTRSPDTNVPGTGDPQAWNRYAYVLGNPLRYTDPSGHCITEDDGYEYEDGWRQTGDSIYECTVYQFIDMPEWLRSAWFRMIFGDGQVHEDSPQAILNFLEGNPALRDPLENMLDMFLRPARNCTLAMTERWGCATGGGGRVSTPPAEQGIAYADPVACAGASASFWINASADAALLIPGGASVRAGASAYGPTAGVVAGAVSIGTSESTASGIQSGWTKTGVGQMIASPLTRIKNVPLFATALSYTQLVGACGYE